MPQRTFCNPVNINYQYQSWFRGRESADPAVVLFKGAYYLFASHCLKSEANQYLP